MAKDGERHQGEVSRANAREFERGDVVLGRCVIDRCVRRDRLASFYAARSLDPVDEGDARCSVWSVHVGIVRRSDRAATVFFDELRHAEAVSHATIPAIVAFDPAAPGPVVIARQALGTSLRDRLTEGELLDTREVARIVREVASALGTLHAAQPPIFHHAVTPERVITHEDRVSLEESGYAHALIVSGLLGERDFEGFAQPGYRLPAAVSKAGGERIDAFLLAVLGYEALTGQLPFGAASVAELDEAVGATLPSARAARPTLPGDIDEVFARAWSPRSWMTVGEFARDFGRVLDPQDGHRPLASAATEVGRSLAAPGDEAWVRLPEDLPPTRKVDVEMLLPMVSAALQASESAELRPGDRRQGRALPPASRNLVLPPSKPTLLGASASTARSPSPLAPRNARSSEPSAGSVAEDPTPIVGYEHISSTALRDPGGRDSTDGPQATEARGGVAELQKEDRVLHPALAGSPVESSVVELDGSLLESSTTNTHLERIMAEIASYQPSDAEALAAALGGTMGEPLETEVAAHTGAELPPVGHGGPAPLVPNRATLRAPEAPRSAPLPPMPPLPAIELPSAAPVPSPPGSGSMRPPRAVSEPPSAIRTQTPPALRRATPLPGRSPLPTTTPPPTRLNTPVPRGASVAARPAPEARAPLTPLPAVSAPPVERVAQAVPPYPRPWSDGLARAAPVIARTNVVAALIATVGLIYASRTLDEYYADPLLNPPRDHARIESQVPGVDAAVAVPAVDVVVSPGAAAVVDASSVRDGTLLAALDAGTPPGDAQVAENLALDAQAATVAATNEPDAAVVRRSAPSGVPGDAVHGRVWAQIQRRVADCVEGIENHSAVTVLVRFDGASGIVQRVRSRGIFAEPPVGPCLEQAVASVRIAPFAATSWDTAFSFPIAPPRWRPPP